MHEIVAYAERQGRTVHIGEVPSGLGCDCRCLNCSAELVARKGPRRAHHFAHRAGTDCQGLTEGALHRLAKEILCTGAEVWIPAYCWSRSAKLPSGAELTRAKELTRAGRTRILDSDREYRAPRDFIPDVRLQVGRTERSKELFVEIVVTHPLDRLKRRLIRKHGIPTIEIRLDASDLSLSYQNLRDKILGNSTAKAWVFHPAQVRHELDFVIDRREAYRVWRRRPALPKLSRSAQISRAEALKHTAAWKPWTTRAGFAFSDAEVEAFNRRHGHYPNLEETREMLRRRR